MPGHITDSEPEDDDDDDGDDEAEDAAEEDTGATLAVPEQDVSLSQVAAFVDTVLVDAQKLLEAQEVKEVADNMQEANESAAIDAGLGAKAAHVVAAMTAEEEEKKATIAEAEVEAKDTAPVAVAPEPKPVAAPVLPLSVTVDEEVKESIISVTEEYSSTAGIQDTLPMAASASVATSPLLEVDDMSEPTSDHKAAAYATAGSTSVSELDQATATAGKGKGKEGMGTGVAAGDEDDVLTKGVVFTKFQRSNGKAAKKTGNVLCPALVRTTPGQLID